MGNVPTNYKIKSNTAPDGTEIDEEKNLGRWINRQRSLYQCGRLKKDRQNELEKIGLKWSVLSTSTWENMYEALCNYVSKWKSNNIEQPNNNTNHNYIPCWDGNVPANYKTDDVPPKNLGRWVNRQRLAFSQNRLCNDHKDKLLSIGLKLDIFNEKKSLSSSNHNNIQQQQQQESLDNDNNLDHYNNVIIDNINSSCQNIISSDESQKKNNLHNEFCLTTTTTS